MVDLNKFHVLLKEAKVKMSKEAKKSAAKDWHGAHPVDHMNIVNHFDQASKAEVHHGKKWYKDAHEYAKTVSDHTGLPRHAIAGLTSVYSPQTDWHSNMITASRVARRRTSVGGKEQKPYHKYGKSFAGDLQKQTADRLLNGEHYEKVIKGQKTKAFARLIDHGGDVDDKNPEVVIDRHAHSVASGARITDTAFDHAGLKTKSGYNRVKQAYIKAADHINKRNNATPADAHYIRPHQLQAVTWLVRQRLNNEEDARAGGKDKKELAKAGKRRAASQTNWRNYSGTWHPGVSHLFEEDNE